MKWREHKKVSEYITSNEAGRIISACSIERDRMFLSVLWETGARINEANRLTCDRVDEVNNCIILPNLKQNPISREESETDEEYKTRGELLKSKIRPPLKRVYLFSNSTLCRDLLAYGSKLDKTSLLFTKGGKPLSEVYVWRLLCHSERGICVRLNIRKIKKGYYKPAWPHLFRHGCGMEMLRRTKRLDVVQELLGHSTIVTTEIYAKVSDEDRKNIVRES